MPLVQNSPHKRIFGRGRILIEKNRLKDVNCVKMQKDKYRENDFCVKSPSEWIN